MKLVAHLTMLMAIALVKHAVSLEAIESSEVDKVMSAEALAPSSIVVASSDGKTGSLQAEDATIGTAEEERVPLSEAEAEGLALVATKAYGWMGAKRKADTDAATEKVKKLKLKDVVKADADALTEKLKNLKLKEGAKVKANATPQLQKSTRPKRKEIDTPSDDSSHTKKKRQGDDVDDQEPSRIRTNPRANVISDDSTRMLELANAIPRRRPMRIKDKNGEFFAHKIEPKRGEPFTLRIPANSVKLESHDQVPKSLLHKKKLELYSWFRDGMLPDGAESMRKTFKKNPQFESVYSDFMKSFNERDVKIREKFPKRYASSVQLTRREMYLSSVNGPAKKYYENEYTIFCAFMKAYAG